MPLRAATGVRVRPATAARRLAALTVAAPPMLNVPYVRQEQDQWCWAACAQMVAAYLGNSSVRQCELANFLHGQSNCCKKPGSAACNQPSPFEGIGQVYGHLQINCISELRPETAQVILRELIANRPVEIGFLWFGGGGHVVLIRGVTPQGFYAVHDPYFGSGIYTYLALYRAYGQGRWAYSFGDFRSI